MAQDHPNAQSLTDPLDPSRARALQATLGIPPSLTTGDPLPPFFHHVYFWDPQVPDNLGRDGHPATGGFIPDLGLPRRMWAAGRLVFHAPMRVGTKATRLSVIENVTRKSGRSGPLAFVRIRHDFKQRHALVLSEWQELVYRPDGPPQTTAEPPRAPTSAVEADVSEPLVANSTTLFRYSALTFNGHRIHYDEAYARRVEGYDGLVVHGPLLAQHLMLLATRRLGVLKEFTYRATAPLLHHETGQLCAKADSYWVAGPDGRQCMIATAR